MKKQIAFYIGWDMGFIALLYAYSNISIRVKKYVNYTFDMGAGIWIKLILLILVGGMIAWMVYVSNQYHFTKKLALVEILLVGIPAFYIATIIAIPFTIGSILKLESFLYPFPSWLITNSDAIIIANILLGYEIVIFMIRVIKCKKTQNTIIDEKYSDQVDKTVSTSN